MQDRQLLKETERLKTFIENNCFDKYHLESKTTTQLAASGLYYCPIQHQIACYYCKKYNSPTSLQKSNNNLHQLDCPFIAGKAVGNVNSNIRLAPAVSNSQFLPDHMQRITTRPNAYPERQGPARKTPATSDCPRCRPAHIFPPMHEQRPT